VRRTLFTVFISLVFAFSFIQGKRSELSGQIKAYNTEVKKSSKQKKENALEVEWRKNQRAMEKSTGKQRYFLKDSEKKKLSLAQQFMDLKSTGRLSSFMRKRRRKNANRDHRWVPEAK
jgi:ribosomal RNA-processing protein 36